MEWIFGLVTQLSILQGITKQSQKKRTSHLVYIYLLCHYFGGYGGYGEWGSFSFNGTEKSHLALLLLVNGLQIRDIRAVVARL